MRFRTWIARFASLGSGPLPWCDDQAGGRVRLIDRQAARQHMLRDLRRLDFVFDARSEPVQISTFDGWADSAVKQPDGEPYAPGTCPLVGSRKEVAMQEIQCP